MPLGSGAFGQAFKATDKEGQSFVVKEINPKLKAGQDALGKLDKLKVEIKTLAKLQGTEHVPKFIGSSTNDNVLRIAMEHIDAPSLKNRPPESEASMEK